MFRHTLRPFRSARAHVARALRRGQPLSVETLEGRLVPAAIWPATYFSPYVNTLEDTSYDYANAAQQGNFRFLTLGFVDGDSQGNIGWGGQTPFGSEGDLEIRNQIGKLRAQGGDVMLSFGGDTEGNNSTFELATVIGNQSQLDRAYQSTIDSLGVNHIDFDIEGNKMMNDQASIERRSQAMADLQAANNNLAIYLTLPCGPDGQGGFGLGDDGLNVVDSALRHGVQLAGVNLMTMDYSDGRVYDGVNAPTMGDAAIMAAQGLFVQLQAEFDKYGIQKNEAQVWQMVDITPQIGVNATNGDGGQEVFTLADAQKVETFAAQQGLGRLGFWAIGRDQNPNDTQGDLTETDSGLSQSPYDFSHIFNEFNGNVPPLNQGPGIPPPPNGVAASAGAGQVIVTWNAVPGATSYNVYRGTDGGQEQWLTNLTTNSFTDIGVANGTTYYYKITAGDDAGESVMSAEVSATLTNHVTPGVITVSTPATLVSKVGAGPSVLLASFSDSDTSLHAQDFTASINWGDGHVSAGAIVANATGGFDVRGSNTYGAEGLYTISLTIHDSHGVAAMATDTIHVAKTGSPPSRLAEAANDLSHSPEYFTNVVVAAYQRYLHRDPDPLGLNSWVQQFLHSGLTDEKLESGFIGSPEYVQNHGGDNRNWIIGMYKDLLGRAPAEFEVQIWLNKLANGMTTQAVAFGFAASVERETQRIVADYQHYLGRNPESQGVIKFWVDAFESGRLTNEGVVAGFVGSQENFTNRFGNIRDWLFAAYQDLLGRQPDPAGFNAWLTVLQSS